MKKKIAILMAASLLILSAAGCGQKTTDNGSQTVSDNGGQTAAVETSADMKKVQGTEMTSDTDEADYSGMIGDIELTIDEAKVIDYDGDKVIVVSYEYKNKGDDPMPFTGSLKVNAYQDERQLTPTAVTGVEGIDMLAMTENVEKGGKKTIQTAYRLKDESTPVTIEVSEFYVGETEPDSLFKTFSF